MHRGLFGRRGAPADADVLGDHVRLAVFTESHIRGDKPTGATATDLVPLREFSFALGLVGTLPLIVVEYHVEARHRIRLLLRE